MLSGRQLILLQGLLLRGVLYRVSRWKRLILIAPARLNERNIFFLSIVEVTSLKLVEKHIYICLNDFNHRFIGTNLGCTGYVELFSRIQMSSRRYAGPMATLQVNKAVHYKVIIQKCAWFLVLVLLAIVVSAPRSCAYTVMTQTNGPFRSSLRKKKYVNKYCIEKIKCKICFGNFRQEQFDTIEI